MRIKSVVFKRSKKGLEEQLKESIDIINGSIQLIQMEGRKAFLKVIAVQLRLMLCDEIPLIKSAISDDLKLPVLSDDFKILEGIKIINVHNMFSDSSKIPMDKWLEQKICKVTIRIPFPKNIFCSKCNQHHSVKKEHYNMSVSSTAQTMLYFQCKRCRESCEINISNYDNNETVRIPIVTSTSIMSLIRSQANKNGGAHVDREVNLYDLGNFDLDSYLIPIARSVIQSIESIKSL
ncbi:hypothetical protein Q9R46_14640 [Paenibacillus sp. RRE4]|uniref:hypothetical protein n=1 Tax=Paenibacillus sp. RRE4 TaxID=2962587 RepID=UPI002880C4E4|nr:hypothetical protein [Paenibacillus sp. RRE4]MDT0123896.1 hypothetical protein [Paenibacillus sp. RRE4]